MPHVYNLTWTSQDNRQAYFKALSEIPEKIVFYTTGYGVWTVPNNNDLNTMKNEFGRDVAWWWNYPCNDNGRSDSQIFPSDMYSNFIDMTQVNDNSRMPTSLEHCAGVLSNPMQQGEISKITLFSVADYAWNNDGFDNMKSWEAAIPAIISENYAPAFRTLAPYLRDNDPSELTTLIQRYKTSIERGQEADAASLKAKMDEIIAACETVAGMETSEVESDRLFFNDLRPWLNLVHDMATTVNDFLEAKDVDNLTDKWTAYLAAQKKANAFATDSRYTVETLESMGTNPTVGSYQVNASAVTLKPFVTEWMGSKAFNDMFPERQSIDAPTAYTTADGITPPRVQSNQAGVCMATSTTYTLAPGDLMAIQLVAPVQIYNLVVADTVYNHFDVVHSQNGKHGAHWPKEPSSTHPASISACATRRTNPNRSVPTVPRSDSKSCNRPQCPEPLSPAAKYGRTTRATTSTTATTRRSVSSTVTRSTMMPTRSRSVRQHPFMTSAFASARPTATT